MRLYYNFHHPDKRLKAIDAEEKKEMIQTNVPWYGSAMQVYTASVATAILAMLVSGKK